MTTPEIRRKIAFDFHKTNKTKKEIAREYGISSKSVEGVQRGIDPMSLVRDKKRVVVKIREDDALLVQLLLEKEGIDHEIPENFELTEKYESKLNY